MKDFTPLLGNSQQIILDSNEQDFHVWEIQIFKSLLTLNSRKSTGPDGISGWVVKENADFFAPFPLHQLKISRTAKAVSTILETRRCCTTSEKRTITRC
jgi:hypothetical protein